MSLDKLTKIDGGGISTTSDYRVGVITATKFVGPVEGSITATDASFSGNVSIAGTLTYEDVTNVDSVGILTARSGIHIDDSISHIGDTDTKIRFPAADTFAIDTAGAERLEINSSGTGRFKGGAFLLTNGRLNVNYNIAHSSTYYLDNDAQILVSNGDSSGTKKSVLKLGGEAALVYGGGSSSLIIADRQNERLRINSSGKVGIGTDNPLQKLHVTDGTSANIYIETKNSTTGSTAGIYYKTSSSAASDFFKTGIVLEDDGTSYARGKLHILQNNTAGNSNATLSDSVVTFTQDGKVGIGTNAPDRVLHIQNITPTIKLTDSDNDLSSQIHGSSGNIYLVTHNTNRDIIFRGGDSSAYEVARITGDGLVGIGTNIPNAVLHVEKNGTNQVLARFESNMGTNNNRALSLTSPTSDSGSLPFTFSTGNSISFKCDSHVVHIDDDGKVGIATDNPTQKVQINNGADDPNIVLLYGADTSTEYAGIGVFQGNATFTGGGIGGTNAGISLRTANGGTETERVRITSDGYVLIGNSLTSVNSETTGTFVVDGGDNNIGGIQIHAGGGENNKDLAGISFSHGNTGTAARPKGAIAFECNGTGYGRGDLCFYVDNVGDNYKVSNVDEKVRFKGNGLVGINTSDPLAKLNIYSENGTATGGILVQNVTYASNQDNPYLTVGTKGWTGATTNWNTAGFQHRIKTDSGGTPRVTIDGANGELFCVRNDKRVGINQSNPSTTLDVNGNIKLTGQLFQSTPADFWSQGNTFIELNGVGNLTHMGSYETCLTSNGYRDDNNQWVSYGVNSKTGAAQIRLNPAGYILFGVESNKSNGSTHNVTERVRITSAGYVGIASAAPTTRLDVFGTGTTLAQFGDPRSTSFECIRIKNNVAGYPSISNDSSGDTLDLRSMGSVQATIDANNNSTGKYFRVVHNGQGDSGTELFKVSDNGTVYVPRGVVSLTRQGASNYVEIGNGQNANNYAYVDMIGDSTYTDYGLRLIRGNSGANAGSQLIHRGTGSLTLQCTEAAQINFNTSGSNTRLSIEAGGNVGINTSNPDHRFHVYHPTTNTVAKFESGDAGCGALFKDQYATTRIEQYNNEFKIDFDIDGNKSDSDRHINLDLNGTTKLSVHHEGVRIGSSVTGTPNQRLHVDGNIYLGPNNTSRIIHSGAALAFSADSNMYFTVDSNDTSGVAPGGEFIWGGGSETNTDSNGDFTEAEFGNGFRARNQYMYLNESSLRPSSNGGLNLGTSSYRWSNIYTSDLDLSNEIRKDEGGNDVDGTWGAYTIQEGENDLFLINRRSGKKYKFNLTEVS